MSHTKVRTVNLENKEIIDNFFMNEDNLKSLLNYTGKICADKEVITVEQNELVCQAYYESVHYNKTIRNPKPFLMKLIRNRITDTQRKEIKERKQKEKDGKQLLEEAKQRFSSSYDDWNWYYILSSLPLKDRELLQLRYQGFSWKKIAVKLNISADAARQRASRLISRLKEEHNLD